MNRISIKEKYQKPLLDLQKEQEMQLTRSEILKRRNRDKANNIKTTLATGMVVSLLVGGVVLFVITLSDVLKQLNL